MTLTKAELIESVYEKVGFSKKEAADLVELVFESMKEELCKGGSIKISGFGKFRVRAKKSRMGRNPQTGDAMVISARKVLTFTPSRILRDGINGKTVGLPSQQGDHEDGDDDGESEA